MKNKMLARRIAIAMLSAGMAVSVTPVGAFAAETVSIESSETAQDSTKKVSVTASTTVGKADATTEKAVADAFSDWGSKTLTDLFKDGKATNDNKWNTPVTVAKVGDLTPDKTSATLSGDVLIFNVSTADGQYVYSISVNYGEPAAANLKDQTGDAEAVYTAFEDYLATNTINTYDGKTVTNGYVANLLKAVKVDAAKNTYTVTGDTKALDADGNGTVTVTVDGIPYTYNFKADVEISTDSDKASLQKAIETVEKNTYPSVAADKDGNNNQDWVAALQAKITSDIKAAGYTGTSTLDLTKLTVEPATATNDGLIYGMIDKLPISITLKYSSADKIAATDKSVGKDGFLKGRGDGTTKYTVDKTENVPVYTFDEGSKLSASVQSLSATTPATVDAVVKAVQDGINAQLTTETDKVADNGVTVTVEEASKVKDASKQDVKTDIKKSGSTYVLLVKESIANDFYGYKKSSAVADAKTDAFNDTVNDGGKKNATIEYVVEVNTPALKDQETTAISLADQTVDVNKAYGSSKSNLTDTLITVTPTVTPADGNSKIDYTVKDENGNDITDTVTGKVVSYVDKDGNKVATKENVLSFLVDKAGKYTVEAKLDDNDDVKATATIAVTDSFSDAMSKSAYYYDAVKWAKTNEITSGIGNNQFGVNKTVTRAEFVTWLYRYAQKANNIVGVKGDTSTLKFTDVSKDAYYAEAVAWASANGVVYGTTDTTFAPNAPVTRAQALTFVWRLAGKPDSGAVGEKDEATTQFTDVHSNDYFVNAVTWAVNSRRSYDGVDRTDYSDKSSKIATGTSSTTFSPNDDCTRSAGISFIYRAFGGNL